MKKIIVSGLHRAGTHSAADKIAIENRIPSIYETTIEFDGMMAVEKCLSNGYMPKYDKKNNTIYANKEKKLENGFALQCPMLASKTLEFCEKGYEVFWPTRKNLLDVAQSMRLGGFGFMSWDIMKSFKNEFPNDHIWNEITYDASDDFWYDFISYHYLTVLVKEYFYRKKFADKAKKVILEDQEYFQEKRSVAIKNKIAPKLLDRLKERNAKNEMLCLC